MTRLLALSRVPSLIQTTTPQLGDQMSHLRDAISGRARFRRFELEIIETLTGIENLVGR